MTDPRTAAVEVLGRYVRLVDDRDVEGLAALLAGAEIQFGDEEPLRGLAMADFFRGLFATDVRGLHQVTDVIVDGPDSAGSYRCRARYVWWRLGDQAEMLAAGEYLATLGRNETGDLELISLQRDRKWSAAVI
jgi:hypothetical protein